MAGNRATSHAEAAVRRLAELNAAAFHLCDWGRRQGLHHRIPWRERLAELPPDAVRVAGPAPDLPAVPMVKVEDQDCRRRADCLRLTPTERVEALGHRVRRV
jgi:hypothetical protein